MDATGTPGHPETQISPGSTEPVEPPARRPGEAAAFLVTLILLVAIALLAVSLWRAIGGDFKRDDAAGAGAGRSQPAADEVLVRVNGQPIRASEFNAAVASLPPQMQAPIASPSGRKALAEELVRMKILEQHARQKGLEKDPEISARLAVATGNILANAALRDIMAGQQPASPRELYDQNLRQFESVQLSQIVVPYQGSVVAGDQTAQSETEAMRKAEQIVARVKGGADFAATARQESADRESAQRGGDLGPIGHGTFPDEVDDLIFSLPVGAISDPVKTVYGVHIFKINGKQTRSFEEVEQALVRSGQQFQMEAAIDDLRKGARVEFNPEFFPPIAPRRQTPAGQ
ncbi:MAG TPA: peptidylprolyl isomerase [Thermoanaerobaculia bacterium]|nr:peptidylprolyl isomerase [Thermoanaerobaculia bacterium]